MIDLYTEQPQSLLTWRLCKISNFPLYAIHIEMTPDILSRRVPFVYCSAGSVIFLRG